MANKKDTEPVIWTQSDKDIGNADKETLQIYRQITQDGLVSTETGKKNGGNNRK